MNDNFDLVLGQQWLVEHRAVIDYASETVTLKKATKSVTLHSQTAKVSYAKKAHHAQHQNRYRSVR